MKKDHPYSRVLIFGLGSYPRGSGVTAAQFFARQGAELRITDLKSKEELAPALKRLKGIPADYILGRHRKEDIDWADLVMRNPAVPFRSPYMQYARAKRKAVKTDVTLLMESVRNTFIGITGTRGKSTVSSLVFSMLEIARKKPILGGNIGHSLLGEMQKIRPTQPLVLEMSSFMTEELTRESGSPHIAALTNLYPDHLDIYPSLRRYYDSKKHLFAFQKPTDYAVLFYDQQEVRGIARRCKARVLWFSLKKLRKHDGVFVDNAWIIVRYHGLEKRLLSVLKLTSSSPHHLHNVLCATAIATALRLPNATIVHALTHFKALPGRMEVVREHKGVTYVNDTQSTIPQAAAVALQAYADKRIFWIAGGNDKGVSYQPLRAHAKRVHKAWILPGTARAKLEAVIPAKVRERVRGMQEALQKTVPQLMPGDVVLLSPAATSFHDYANAPARGKEFIRLVSRIL